MSDKEEIDELKRKQEIIEDKIHRQGEDIVRHSEQGKTTFKMISRIESLMVSLTNSVETRFTAFVPEKECILKEKNFEETVKRIDGENKAVSESIKTHITDHKNRSYQIIIILVMAIGGIVLGAANLK